LVILVVGFFSVGFRYKRIVVGRVSQGRNALTQFWDWRGWHVVVPIAVRQAMRHTRVNVQEISGVLVVAEAVAALKVGSPETPTTTTATSE
jgi:hypothetical protein